MLAFVQFMVYYFLIYVQIKDFPTLNFYKLTLLILSTMLIAAAGYIINDYFDIKIDRINRPHSVVAGTRINNRMLIIIYTILNIIAVVIGIYLACQLHNLKLLLLQLIPIGLLWFYSTSYKKQLLIGNIIVALLSALSVAVPIFYEQVAIPPYYTWEIPVLHFIFRALLMYSTFAFLLSLIREVVKDIEDQEGDAALACNTIPIKWGIPRTKFYILGLTLIVIGLLIYACSWVLQRQHFNLMYLIVLLLILPLIYFIYTLYTPDTKLKYQFLSVLLKIIMFLGISTLFFMKDFRVI